MDKRMTSADVLAELRDGMTLGIGGWGSRRKPMALVREILRSPLKDLTVVTYGGPDAGLLCKYGKVKKLIYGFVSLDSIALEPHFRQARQAGSFQAAELDEGMLQWGLRAAAYLEHCGFGDVVNLSGGIDAWARGVDPRMATY